MATESTSQAGVIRTPSSTRPSTTSSHSSSGSSSTASSDSRQYWTKETYEKRYKRAIAAGMSPEKAKQYASATYASVADGPLEFGIFRKTSSDKKIEDNEAADAKLFNDLLDSQRTMDENSPAAENQRLQAAGINTALTGGDQLGTGDSEGVDDLASDQVDSTRSINADAAALPGQIASNLATAIGGVMNVVNSGVNLYDTFFDMDIAEGKATFDTINAMSDLGNFFPFLNIGYDPEEDTWYDLDDPNNVKLDSQYVLGLPYDDFMNRIRKRTGVRTNAYAKSLYNAYRSMVSPKAINSYMDSRKKNIDLQNDTVDSMAGGIPRKGSLTVPQLGFGAVPGLASGSKFESTADRSVFDYYVQTLGDLQLYGIQAQSALARAQEGQANVDFTTSIINQKCYDTLSDLVTRLRTDSVEKHSALATYLLLNMLSNSFPTAAQAQWIYNEPSRPKNLRDFFDQRKDNSVMSFLEGTKLLGGNLGKFVPTEKVHYLGGNK